MRLYLYPRYISILASAVLLLEIVAAVWIFWQMAGSIMASKDRIAELQASITGFGRDRVDAAAADELRASRSGDIAQIETFFPDRDRPIEFLKAMDSLGKATGNTLAISLDDRAGNTGYLAFNLEVSGSAENLQRYLRALELMPYRIEIQELAYQNQAARGAITSGSPRPPNALHLAIRVRTNR